MWARPRRADFSARRRYLASFQAGPALALAETAPRWSKSSSRWRCGQVRPPRVDPDLFTWVEGVLAPWGIELRALMLAWARVAPSVAIVPAFGLRGLPAPVRVGLAVCLALLIVPTISQQTEPSGAGGFAVGMLWQSVIGLPIAGLLTGTCGWWRFVAAPGRLDYAASRR